jgi:hypothetical protein
MGYVILPSGTSVWVEELNGSINLSQLINDMQCEDYTASYRISIIAALGKLGKNAESSLSYLKQLAENKNERNHGKILAEAADQAKKKIEDGRVITPTSNDNHLKRGGLGSAAYAGPYRSWQHNSYVEAPKKPERQKVTFEEIECDGELHDGLKHYSRCHFCEKMTVINPYQRAFSDRLAGPDTYYCSYCIRNDYYHRFNRNVMVLTYRGIIGYYYYAYFAIPKSCSMHMPDIHEYVDMHIKAGLQNPIFRYDAETYCWFIDFGKIGKRKMSIESVLQTIIEQLACFNLCENVRGVSTVSLYKKYHRAVMEFYQNRVRVNGDKVFAPTLWGCGIPTTVPTGSRAIPVYWLQGFSPFSMIDNSYNRSSHRRY